MVSQEEKIIIPAEKKSVGEHINDKISHVGEYLFMALMTSLGYLGRLGMVVLEFIVRGIINLCELLAVLFRHLGGFLGKPFVRYGKAIRMGQTEIRNAREESALKGFATWIRVTGRIIFGKRGIAVTLCNYALPVISCVFLFNIVTYASSMTYALKLNVNGDFVGYITDETVFTDAEKIVQQRINYMDSNTETITFVPAYEVDMVGHSSMLTQYQLADKLLASMNAEIIEGYGMYIGSSFYGALEDKTSVEETLDDLLDVYRTGAQGETVNFENEISFEPGLYLAESVVSDDSIIRLITSKRSVAAYYTAQEGDSPSAICDTLGMTYEEIAALNPGFSEDTVIYVGDRFLIDQEEPFLAVTVTRLESYDVYTDYDTEHYDDSTHYVGSYTTYQEGVPGTDRVTANVSYINGVEVRRKEITRITVTDPVTEIIYDGTKELPPDLPISIQDVGYGEFYWPIGTEDGGQINEMVYGHGGYYGHSGIDIGAPYGTPIIAADSGTVILSQWYYGYGNCIMIQHDNGIVTVYGHCSYLHVGVGERVTQGQQIADVGATGRATGNHLHFEVRINGVWYNPINYLPWHKRAPGCVEY